MSSSKAWFDFAELGFQALFHRTLQCLQLTNWFPVCPLFVSPLHPTARVWHPLVTSSSEAKSSLFCCWILSNMLWSDSEEKTFLFSTSGIRKMFAAKNSLEKKNLQLINMYTTNLNHQLTKTYTTNRSSLKMVISKIATFPPSGSPKVHVLRTAAREPWPQAAPLAPIAFFFGAGRGAVSRTPEEVGGLSPENRQWIAAFLLACFSMFPCLVYLGRLKVWNLSTSFQNKSHVQPSHRQRSFSIAQYPCHPSSLAPEEEISQSTPLPTEAHWCTGLLRRTILKEWKAMDAFGKYWLWFLLQKVVAWSSHSSESKHLFSSARPFCWLT